MRRARARSGLGRAGFAALLAGSRPQYADALEPVLRAHRGHHPQADLALLARAYQVAEASHRGQTRKSGEPYITHPLAVTMILSQLGAETTTLVAALLHDTVEDTAVTLDQVRDGFGDEVAYLVDGVTKLEKVDFGAAAEAETFRKMLLATGEDVRVMVIKLADRLHNMRTIRHMKPASRIRIAKVTRDVLIPLAERLGIQVVKTELEDIVFATLHPEEYAETRALVTAREAAARDEGLDPLAEFAGALRRQLREARIQAEVSVRPRHCVSLHRTRLGRPDPSPTDFGRVLVVVEENADCYAVLGELHTCWTPLPGEFKDFVAAPKFNLYQSLHTAVAVDRSEVVEVLVRTTAMHRVAEFGVVAMPGPGARADDGAEDGGSGARDELDRTDPARPGWLSRMLEWQRETPDADSFWSALTADLAGDGELTVVTEDGRTLHLPNGSSCVDAAYALGEDIGHRCIGVRLGGRLAALSTPLHDGDVVDVLTEEDGEGGGPSREWLSHARTATARIAIERWLAGHPEPVEAWEEPRELPHQGGERPLPGPAGRRDTAGPDAGGRDAAGGESAGPERGGRDAAGRDAAARDTGGRDAVREGRDHPAVVAEGMPGASVRLARCCTPVPPDPLIGFRVKNGIAVHRRGCVVGGGAVAPTGAATAAGTGEGAGDEARASAVGPGGGPGGGGRAPVPVSWAPDAAPSGYMVTVQADALGRPRLLADLTAAMSAVGVDIVSASVEPPQELRVRHRYTVELPDPGLLPELMRAMLRVAGVFDVYREVPQGVRNTDDRPEQRMRPSWGIRSAAAAFTDQEAAVPSPDDATPT